MPAKEQLYAHHPVDAPGQGGRSGLLSLRFGPLANSRGQTYTLSLDRAAGSEQIAPVLLSQDDWYTSGSLAIDGTRRLGDLALQTYYKDRVSHVLWIGLKWAAGQIRLLLLLAIMLVAPGFVLTRLLSRYEAWVGAADPWVNAWQHLALYVALSLSLLAVLHVVAELLGMPVRPQAIGAGLVVLLVMAIVLAVHSLTRSRPWRSRPLALHHALQKPNSDRGTDNDQSQASTNHLGSNRHAVAGGSTFGVVSLLVFGGILLVRLGQVHVMDYPLSINSVQHAHTCRQFYRRARRLPDSITMRSTS